MGQNDKRLWNSCAGCPGHEYSNVGTSCRAQTAATVLLFSCQDASKARSAYATATPRFHYYREIMNIFCLWIGPFENI